MDDENNRQYVRTTEIPEWMASTLGSATVGSTNAEFTVDWDAANGLFTA